MSIRQRFILLIAGSIAGFFSILILLNHTLNQLEQLYLTEDKLSSSHIQLQLMARKAQNFSLNNQEESAQEFQQQADELKQTLKLLEEQFRQQELPLPPLSRVIQGTSRYTEAFSQLRTQKLNLGLTPVTGMYGQLRKAVHQAEQRIKDAGQTQLTAAMLMLRRHEKDFMLRHQIKYVQKFDSSFQIFEQQLDNASALNPQQKDGIRQPMQQYQQTFKRFVQVSRSVGLDESQGALGELNARSQQLIQELDALHNDTRTQIESLISSKRLNAMVLTVLLCVVLTMATVWLAWRVVSRINLVVGHMKEISDGDGNLSVHLNSQSPDELGELSRAFNRFTEKIRNSVSHAAETATTLESRANQLHNTANSTLETCHQQDSQLQELSQALSNTTSYSQQVESRVEAASDMTRVISTQSDEIAQLSQQNQTASKQLITDVEAAVQEIEQLEADSQKISEVMASIAEIAAQTNLLALNAAIEAARAGEQGRGFAVVADEVRNLSLKTQDSAVQIYQQIDQLQDKIRHATQVIRNTQSSTNERLRHNERIDELFSSIEHRISELNTQNQAIVDISQQQIATMHQAEQQLYATQEAMRSNLESADTNRHTSDQLFELSGMLKQEMGRFTV
ncbi:methyl-accepting chemotaxis protein [Oceanospirillum sediminis]|uniref:Methyl-accepting chemotaxis protein n=1 Tax=Oceanospirillum sediminis TaxID=2760088 RepID=A0A839IJG9_9GAMM|nr:methyl-accepting chemotaxis protein [Oceanospirillum sediminis]MBB1485051.1 methyl-accepting chemotaxis protein [Oceanospirillum sediminis]